MSPTARPPAMSRDLPKLLAMAPMTIAVKIAALHSFARTFPYKDTGTPLVRSLTLFGFRSLHVG